MFFGSRQVLAVASRAPDVLLWSPCGPRFSTGWTPVGCRAVKADNLGSFPLEASLMSVTSGCALVSAAEADNFGSLSLRASLMSVTLGWSLVPTVRVDGFRSFPLQASLMGVT